MAEGQARFPEDVKMPFGKHGGKTLSEIVQDDPAYLDWLKGTAIRSDRLREAVGLMCKKYAAEIDRAIGED